MTAVLVLMGNYKIIRKILPTLLVVVGSAILIWKFQIVSAIGIILQREWLEVHRFWQSKFLIYYATFLFYIFPILVILNMLFIIVDYSGRPSSIYNRRILNSYDTKLDWDRFKDAGTVWLTNFFLVTPIFMIFYYFAMLWRGFDFSYNLPSIWTVICQFVLFICFQDVFAYYNHRFILHHPKIYKYIHRKHHEHKVSISLSLFYLHPIDHITQNLWPIHVGPLFVAPHFLTFLAWVTFAGCWGTCVHSGYRFPMWSFAEHHDFHHFYGYGNYSTFQIMDKFHGTELSYPEKSKSVKQKRTNPK